MQTWTALGHGELVGEGEARVSVRTSYRLHAKNTQWLYLQVFRDFRMMRRSVVDAIFNTDRIQSFKGLFAWVGF